MKNQRIELKALSPIYKQLNEIIGEENMLAVYSELKGVQVTFPAHLYSADEVFSFCGTEHFSYSHVLCVCAVIVREVVQ